MVTGRSRSYGDGKTSTKHEVRPARRGRALPQLHASTPPRTAGHAGPDGRPSPGLPTARRGGREMSMAVVMSEMPDVWRKVLAEHVPDGQQYCRACFHDGGRASW